MIYYKVEYQDSNPIVLRFEPDPTNSNGTYNHKLFSVAMSRFCPKGWHWDGKHLSTRLNFDQPGVFPTMVEQTQAKVSNIMDKLAEFQNFLYVIKEYNAQSNPK